MSDLKIVRRDLESKINELTAGDDEESKEMRRKLKQQARFKIQGH